MKHYFICALISLLLAACNSNATHESKIAVSKEQEKVILKPFSDYVKADTFRVVLTGKKPKDMVLTFTITAYDGSQIYTKVLKATDLVENYGETLDLSKKKAQVKFMNDELNLFFEDENFLEPAVTDQEHPDQYTTDKIFYNELKKTGLNGFKYRLGKESKVYIGWSDKEHKVKVYYKCC